MASISDIRLRPSMGPIAKNCPASMFMPRSVPQIIDPPNAAMATGTALHEIFKDLVYPGHEISNDGLEDYCLRHNVVMDGFYGIGWRARQMAEKWAKVSQWYQDSELEVSLHVTLDNGFVLSGTPDLFKVYGDYAVVFDLKTGLSDMNYFPQVEIYAMMLWKMNAALGLKEVHVALFSPMLEKYESKRLSADYLAGVEREYIAAMEVAETRFCVGNHCRYCKRLTSCPAIRQQVEVILNEFSSGEKEIQPEDIARARPIVKAMGAMVAQYEATEKAIVERLKVVPIDGGYELALQKVEKKSYLPVPTYALLTKEGVPADKVLEGMQITSESIDDLAGIVAPPRKKGATQKRIKEELMTLGAVQIKPYYKMIQRQTKEKEE